MTFLRFSRPLQFALIGAVVIWWCLATTYSPLWLAFLPLPVKARR